MGYIYNPRTGTNVWRPTPDEINSSAPNIQPTFLPMPVPLPARSLYLEQPVVPEQPQVVASVGNPQVAGQTWHPTPDDIPLPPDMPTSSGAQINYYGPQTRIPYYRNPYTGQLFKMNRGEIQNPGSGDPVYGEDTEARGISVEASTADLNRRRAEWAKQDMAALPVGGVGGVNTRLADARQALINAHGITPMQLPVSQVPQLAMQMAQQIAPTFTDPYTGQTYGGAAGNHPIAHTAFWKNRWEQEASRQASLASIKQTAEDRRNQSYHVIGAQYAGQSVPDPTTGIAAMDEKHVDSMIKAHAAEEAEKTGGNAGTIGAQMKYGWLMARHKLLGEQRLAQAARYTTINGVQYERQNDGSLRPVPGQLPHTTYTQETSVNNLGEPIVTNRQTSNQPFSLTAPRSQSDPNDPMGLNSTLRGGVDPYAGAM